MQTKKFRVVTYNIHRAIGVDRRFRPSRIVEILAHYRADVVLLQEVDDGAPRSKHMDLARELAESLDYPHYAVGHNVSLRKGRYGNATLSRFPILEKRNIDMTIGDRKRRGCQHTLVATGARGAYPGTLHIFNLHLGLSARERVRQVGILARSSEFKHLGPEVPCIVGGDFNDWRSQLHPIFTEFLEFRCATQMKTGPIRSYPSFSPTGGLDRVYYRGPLRHVTSWRCRMRLSKVASDHLPVISDFRLRRH